MAGNIMGVGEVKVEDGHAASVDDGTQYYIIKSGDTLSAIAKQFYGDANKYPRIFEANREVIKNADLIFPGQKIRIPRHRARTGASMMLAQVGQEPELRALW